MEANDLFRSVSVRPGLELRVRACGSDVVGVAREAGEHRVVALCGIEAGQTLFRIEGMLTDRPTRYSVQVGEGSHLDVGEVPVNGDRWLKHYWRFLNHGCDPNAVVRGREVVAVRDIQPGEDVTFNYNTTEDEMAEPFECRCGSPWCVGWVRGFRHLGLAERERLRSWLAPHLLRQLPWRTDGGAGETGAPSA